MPTKRDDYEDEDTSESAEEKKGFSLSLSTIVLGILFLIICEAFLYLLSTKTDSSLGLTQMIFGLFLAIVITLFFSWVNYLMQSNKYLGVIIGIAGIGSGIYALTRNFAGPFTTTFVIIGLIVGLGYLLIHFLKNKSE